MRQRHIQLLAYVALNHGNRLLQEEAACICQEGQDKALQLQLAAAADSGGSQLRQAACIDAGAAGVGCVVAAAADAGVATL